MDKRIEKKKAMEVKAGTLSLAKAPKSPNVKQTLTIGQKLTAMLKSKYFWGIWGVIGAFTSYKFVFIPSYQEHKLKEAEEYADILYEQRHKRTT